jgi:hypothetical protein
MRVVLIPTKTEAACELRRSSPRPSKRTVTCGIPSTKFDVCTVPGHHLPLPRRTIHTHTGAPAESSTTSVGSISSFVPISPRVRPSANLVCSQFECCGERFVLNFDFARKLAIQQVEKFILGAKLGAPVVAFDGHCGAQAVAGDFESFKVDV